MKPTTHTVRSQPHKPAFRGGRTQALADLLLDDVDDDSDDLDGGLLHDVGLGGRGRGSFGDFGGDDGAHLWR